MMDDLRAIIDAAQRQRSAEHRPRKYVCRRDASASIAAPPPTSHDVASAASATATTAANTTDAALASELSSQPPTIEACSAEATDTKTGGFTDPSRHTNNEEDVARRLRALNLPVRLFGELGRARVARLRYAEATSDDGAKSGGLRNEYAQHMARTEAGLELELLRNRIVTPNLSSSSSLLLSTNVSDSNISRKMGATASTDQSEDAGDDSNNNSNNNGKSAVVSVYRPEYDVSKLAGQLFSVDPDLCLMLVYVFLRRLLDDWDRELTRRTPTERRSRSGKLDYTNFVQTKLNLKPFFKLIKRKAVKSDVINKVADILACVRDREYMRAHTAYLQLAIGNSPWPIGVTMVGIHERSAREKLYSNQVAHVLNDETQRKWIQSLKRLMTFAQLKYPPSDLTKLSG